MKGFATCSHLSGILNRHKADYRISESAAILLPYQFDTFAFLGNSGALMAPVLAHKMGKELIMVRKPGVDCVSMYPVEGFQIAKRYVIVDDMISTGETVANTIVRVNGFAPDAKLIGMLLYATGQLLHLPGDYNFHYVKDVIRRFDPTFNFDAVIGDPYDR